jgi:hypothetical protein
MEQPMRMKAKNVLLVGRRRSTGVVVFPFVLLALGFGANCVDAAQWQFDPRIAISGNFDDNYRLTDVPGQQTRVSGGAADAAIAVHFLPRAFGRGG